MQKLLYGIVFGLLAVGSANAALVSRSGGLAYYDTETNLIWVADANLAQTSGYDADGLMNWAAAQTWIGSLNAGSYLGTNDWRLPTVTDTGAPGCDYAYSGTDCGYSVDLSTGEMAHLFHSTLGNDSWNDPDGNTRPCAWTPQVCLTNTGPFPNIQNWAYWSGTTDAAYHDYA
jgi:hypothetical protein